MNGIKHRIKWIIIGSLAGAAFAALMTLILSWIVLNSGGIDEGLYAPLSVIALCLGAAAGGAISAKGCGNKLLVTGLITGAAVYLIITAISCAMGAVPQTAGLFRIPAAVLSAGLMPVIIGSGSKKRRRRSGRRG